MADKDSTKKIYLNNENYQNWKATIKWRLIGKKAWKVTITPPPADVKPEWTAANARAMECLMLSICKDQITHVRDLDVAYEVWSTLQRLYERKTLTSRIFMIRKFWTKRYESGSMQDHITHMQDAANRLRKTGSTLDLFEEIAGLLASLPNDYDGLVTALEGRDLETLTMELITSKLLDEYTRRVEGRSDSKNSALYSKMSNPAASEQPNSTPCCELAAMTCPGQRSRGAQPRALKDPNACFYCGKLGHVKAECRKLMRDQQRLKGHTSNSVETSNAVAASGSHMNFHAFCAGTLETTLADRSITWLMDSGCTSHMTNAKHVFRNMTSTQATVSLAGKGHSIHPIGQRKRVRQQRADIIPPQEGD
jgi:hypothetical protein